MNNFNLKYLAIGVILLSILLIGGSLMFGYLNTNKLSPSPSLTEQDQSKSQPPTPTTSGEGGSRSSGGSGGGGGGPLKP